MKLVPQLKQRTRKMKKDIHPDYHFIDVKMTDGTIYKTKSTYGKKDETLNLEIDPLTHPAWTGEASKMLDSDGQVAKFQKKFKNLGFKK